jgi:hypothetical protein
MFSAALIYGLQMHKIDQPCSLFKSGNIRLEGRKEYTSVFIVLETDVKCERVGDDGQWG